MKFVLSFKKAHKYEVYECVIHWVKHELASRYDCLPKLMEHVRLPLISMQYIPKNLFNEQYFINIVLNSACWVPVVDMLGDRRCFGVGILSDCVVTDDTDAWSIETFSSTNINTINEAVVIDRSVYFNDK
ncbi:uncharacterized protein LOC115033206 [Acyrthosiphon pisum]|uniref:BACK domain-containing protein n=1 Tax=Acyrthosiphon pisum TaxID=7029 RepID=A0A8R2JLF6_ACYPI|nr:uncharacterized protein LOC115033206 [Acyrthosiphon pisum]